MSMEYVGNKAQQLRRGYGGKTLCVKSDALEAKFLRTLAEKTNGIQGMSILIIVANNSRFGNSTLLMWIQLSPGRRRFRI